MNKTIGMAEVQQKFDQIFNEVAKDQAAYILTRNDHPEVVMISYEEYLRLRSREEVTARFNRIWAEIGAKNAGFSEEEVEADLELATRELRERHRQ